MINAASDVANGAQAYYAFRDNGLDPTNINEETRRALRMIGGNMRNIMDSRNTDEWNAMMNGRKEEVGSRSEEGGIKYSIRRDADGEYVYIDTDQSLFDGKTTDEQAAIARKLIANKFSNGGNPIDTGNVNAKINSRSASEYAYPRESLRVGKYSNYLRASAELDNLLAVSVFESHREPKLDHKYDFANGYDYYKTRFMVNGIMYTGIINVGIRKDGVRVFHGISAIRRASAVKGQGAISPTQQVAEADSNIPQRETEVKKFLTPGEAFEADQEQEETHYGDHQSFSLRVRDKKELDFLNNQETYTTYKTMQLVDGKLYPPMAAVVAGSMEDHSELGAWEKATEHPELIRNGNKFTLNKGKGKGSIEAAYNPYMHSSNLMINDQFSGAWNRPDLVTVECEVPASENTSNYHAEYAKDTTGWKSWHTGTVAGQLRNAKGIERQVFLSRWIRPVRIVPDAEVAQHYKDLIQGTNIEIPDNVVSPSLRRALEAAGVPIKVTGKVKESYSLKCSAGRDAEYMRAVESEDEAKQRELVERAAKDAGFTKRVYHGTPNGGFTTFKGWNYYTDMKWYVEGESIT